MVVYGKVSKAQDGTHRSAKCVHGGTEFIVPLFQSYAFLDLTPISISVDLKSALSRQNIRIDVPSIFTVGISTEQGVMQNAAERLLGLKLPQIQELAKDIIHSGIYITGGGAQIQDLDTLFGQITNISVNTCEAPEESAVRGLVQIVSDSKYKRLPFSIKNNILR